jgi:hypothetical protein
MYILALAILLGLAVATVTEIVYEVAPAISKVKYLGNPDILFPLLAIVAVWSTDTSILGAYGLNGAEWFDVVGSGLAVAAVTKATDAVVNYLNK